MTDEGDGKGLEDPGAGGRVDILIERGLGKYSQGDLVGAISEWEHALSLDSQATRAAEYITYVRDNYQALEDQFRAARDIEEFSLAEGVPVPESREEESDSGAYDSVELETTMEAEPRPVLEDMGGSLEADLAEVSAGLDTLRSGTITPPPQPAPSPGRQPVVTIMPRGAGASPSPAPGPPRLELDLEAAMGLSESPIDPHEVQLELSRPVTGMPLDSDEDEPTIAVGSQAEEETEQPTEIEIEAEFDDSLATDKRSPFGSQKAGAFVAPERAAAREAAEAPPVIIEEAITRRRQALADDNSETKTRRWKPGAVASPEEELERLRRRVGELVELAREAAKRGDFRSAVEAAEMASQEDPDGKVAPVILHRHRDTLLQIYEGHIGDLSQVPLVSVPLHEIAAQSLDHRTGFLLSRIDGMLSFEDILDVAGMPRMEAYQILSSLLRKGFIEVR